MEISEKDYEELIHKVEHLETKIKAMETRLEALQSNVNLITTIEQGREEMY